MFIFGLQRHKCTSAGLTHLLLLACKHMTHINTVVYTKTSIDRQLSSFNRFCITGFVTSKHVQYFKKFLLSFVMWSSLVGLSFYGSNRLKSFGQIPMDLFSVKVLSLLSIKIKINFNVFVFAGNFHILFFEWIFFLIKSDKIGFRKCHLAEKKYCGPKKIEVDCNKVVKKGILLTPD